MKAYNLQGKPTTAARNIFLSISADAKINICFNMCTDLAEVAQTFSSIAKHNGLIVLFSPLATKGVIALFNNINFCGNNILNDYIASKRQPAMVK